MWRWVEERVDPKAFEAPEEQSWVWTEAPRQPLIYRCLGVSPTATQSEIRQAYRRLARALHPDLRNEAERQAAQLDMAELNLAYEILADPERRAAYDREHIAAS